MVDLKLESLPTIELLRLSGRVADLLRERAVTRTSKVIGDYAEHLFLNAFGWKPAGTSSNKGFDAVHRGKRYEIKSRRCTQRNPSRILGDLRAFDEVRFDFLAVAIFGEDFRVYRAAIMSHETVRELSRNRGSGVRRLTMNDVVWTRPGVRDVTEALRAAQERT